MDLKIMEALPPWEWPEDAPETLLAIIQDRRADAADRLLAVPMAGEYTVINDELAAVLLAIVGDREEPEELRGLAAISLGPGLEVGDTEGFEECDCCEPVISEETFNRIREDLHRIYLDPNTPPKVRRMVLEAAVRAPLDWHRDAVRAASASGDEAWKLTAVFCMRYIDGFDDQILEALDHRDPAVHYYAVLAAGAAELDAAWPHVIAILDSETADKDLLLAAIEAAGSIRPEAAGEVLGDFLDSDDEEIADAAGEAIVMADGIAGFDDDES